MKNDRNYNIKKITGTKCTTLSLLHVPNNLFLIYNIGSYSGAITSWKEHTLTSSSYCFLTSSFCAISRLLQRLVWLDFVSVSSICLLSSLLSAARQERTIRPCYWLTSEENPFKITHISCEMRYTITACTFTWKKMEHVCCGCFFFFV